MNLDEACLQILGFDKDVRFAGFADSLGRIVAGVNRKDIVPHLTKEESELSVAQAAIRMGIRKRLEPKLGRMLYSLTIYENVKRVSISLYSTVPKKGEVASPFVLLLSLEPSCKHERLVMNKVMPFLEKEGIIAVVQHKTVAITS